MATKTIILRPNSDISIPKDVEAQPSDTSLYYTLINEVTSDDSNSYIEISSTADLASNPQLFSFIFGTDNFTKKLAITKINLFIRYSHSLAMKNGSGFNCTPKINLSNGTSIKYTANLATFSHPTTEEATPDVYKNLSLNVSNSDIAIISNLLNANDYFQIQFDITSYSGVPRITQTYMTIEYDEGITFYEKLNNSWTENVGFLYKYENKEWIKQDTITSSISSILTSTSYNTSLPDGYMPLNYIESNGRQYIDTGFKPNNNTRITVDTQLLTENPTAQQAIFGARNDNASQFFAYYRYANNAWAHRYGNGTTNNLISLSSTDRVKIIMDKSIMYINDSSVVCESTSSFSSNVNAYLFCVNNNDTPQYTCKARLYSCKIYDNEILIRDFIPCINSNNISGLYDIINNVFYSFKNIIVENKLYIETTEEWWEDEEDGTYGKNSYTKIKSTYPVASDVSVSAEFIYATDEPDKHGQPPYYTYTYLIPKNMSTSTKEEKSTYWYDANGVWQDEYGGRIHTVSAVDPIQDDSFIYTFVYNSPWH